MSHPDSIAAWRCTVRRRLRLAGLVGKRCLCGVLIVGVLRTAGAAAPAAAPVAIISGPTQAKSGDLVILDASGSQNAMGFAWVLADSDKSFLPVENGQRLIFASADNGTFTFVLVAANADANGEPQVAIAKHVVQIGDSPPPGPAPGPNPGPAPQPLPPGRFNLATQSRDWAALVNLAAADRQRAAQALASSFDAMASKMGAGAVTTIQDAVTQTKTSNQAALGGLAAAWVPWGNQWTAALAQLNSSGQVKVMQDLIDAWHETATGLRAVQ